MPVQLYFGLAAELLAIITGTYLLKKNQNRFLFLYIYVWIGFFAEISQPILFFQFGIRNNLIIGHIFYPLEFLLLALMYSKELGQFYKRQWLVLIIVVFMLFAIINPMFLQKLTEFSQLRSFSSIILVLFSILYFYQVMMQAKVKKLADDPMIWINVAILLYFALNLFYNILFMYLLQISQEFLRKSAFYFGLLNILFYLLIAVGFWKAVKQNKSTSL